MSTNDSGTGTGRPETPLYIDLFASQAMFTAFIWPVMGLIGQLPRNADNSMKAIYTIPTYLVLALVCCFLLWKRVVPHRALRLVCWWVIALAVLLIPATLIDVVQRNGV